MTPTRKAAGRRESELPVNMRAAERVLMVSVVEGNGGDIPYQIVRYIIHPDGSILGKVDDNWIQRGTLMK